ncbi:YoaK family protein [Methylobacterium brachythecii]|uniref:Uncharacterized membrane protein YoaK (UPF0700 family) n=1 Tax=Methylobacterium brachythecii TaxID=1176177 RepID=A0A7W6AGW6_9HYPH|nr:YoaK family protein [Methylobacterium brachythecii]MBB3902111.1 uncharacterized membrane protein YoaK (UPF0700 family) [Methylobacterium brachythecii]GLS44508.1 hypothetical protein GCM10007884_24960 [Methylobacterium brachythecii]
MSRPILIAFGLMLTALAGFIDAIGFIRLGGLYTSLMSGNTTQLAVAIGHGEGQHALLPFLLILAFLVGAVMGGAIAALAPERWATPAILAFETIAVASAFLSAHEQLRLGTAALFLSLAMGTQNAVLAHIQGFRAGTTFVTGALFSFGQKIALALAGRGTRFGWAGDGLVWLALMVGAVAGTVAHTHYDIDALAIPAVIMAVLAAWAATAALVTGRAIVKPSS